MYLIKSSLTAYIVLVNTLPLYTARRNYLFLITYTDWTFLLACPMNHLSLPPYENASYLSPFHTETTYRAEEASLEGELQVLRNDEKKVNSELRNKAVSSLHHNYLKRCTVEYHNPTNKIHYVS